ncbi:MAG: helix-turn-helix transcriptional regulator [Bdellovibrionota bacterium]|nr:helix-turn-helix transcriptional regulator [Bdellovibrionota bacterium]
MSKVFQLHSIPYSKSLGKFFKNARKQVGLTQTHLAESLGLKSPQFVSNVERGICAYTSEQLQEVIYRCNIDSEELIRHFMDVYKIYIEEHI